MGNRSVDESVSTKDRVCARIVEYGILGLAVLTPLPAASVYEWSTLAIQLVVLLMAGAYAVMGSKPSLGESLARAARPARVLFFAFAAFVVLQLVPLPNPVAAFLSPQAQAFRKLYSVDFGRASSMSLSLIPLHTVKAGLELLTYFLLGFLVFRTVRHRSQIMRIWTVLIAMGVFEAAYGLFELYDKSPRILLYKKIFSLDSVTGTFVNRDHLSGYLEMIIPLAIGLLISRASVFSGSTLTWKERALRFQEQGFFQSLLLFFSVIVMAVGIVFSNSRSGLFILLTTFVLFFGLVTIYFGSYPSRKKWIKNSISLVFLAILSICFYFGIRATLERFSLDSLLHEERPIYWAYTLQRISSFPLVGTGLGTYGALAPNLERESVQRAIVHAHNDYLESLSEVGAIGFSLLWGGIFYVLIRAFLTWRRRSNSEIKGLALGGIISVICILIHSLTDFNLHIPANLVLFSIVLPLTLVTAYHKRGASRGENS